MAWALPFAEAAMAADYPAAHSMDSVWFAVDAAGHVAYFDTGSNGPVPEGEENDIRHELWQLWKPAGEEPDDDWDTDFLCAARGVYYFGYCGPEDYGPVGLYRREIVPEVPVHIDQLPPDLRARCLEDSFDVRFDQVELFQPLEHVGCVFFDDSVVAYLCADGKTIRPIKGQEEGFADFVRAFRAEQPERAASFTFDGPTE
jgi:hypothetical protein